MTEQKSADVFDAERASTYENKFSKLAALKDALMLIAARALSELPSDARVLCVGTGTGTELIALGNAFPGWSFVAVEPSAPMLAICRERLDQAGLSSRCELHAGYLDSLPPSEPFDGATSILVDHFLVEPDARRAYFTRIAERLRPRAVLVSACLASDVSAPAHAALLELWMRAMAHAGLDDDALEKHRANFDGVVALLPPREVESMIEAAGFAPPVHVYQAILMHGWFTRRG